MNPSARARAAGLVFGAVVMSAGLVLSLELGVWSHSLVSGTLIGAMDHRDVTPMTGADLESSIAQLHEAPEPQRRIEAAVRLARSRNAIAVPALVQALRDPDTRVQRAAALALGEFEETTASRALQELLRTTSDRGTRQATAFSLGVIHARTRR
jgi:HEAT repeats